VYWDYGFHNQTTFQNDDATGELQIKYMDAVHSRSATVTLHCDRSEEGTLVNTGSTNFAATFILTSKYCCPQGRRGGRVGSGDGWLSIEQMSYMYIMFMVAVLICFVGAITLVLHFAKRAPRPHTIPNIGLGTEVPGLIKNGVSFVVIPARKTTR